MRLLVVTVFINRLRKRDYRVYTAADEIDVVVWHIDACNALNALI